MIKPKTQDIGRQIVQITPEGQGRIGTIVGINRKVIFIKYEGRGAVESAKREYLHWYGNGKENK